MTSKSPIVALNISKNQQTNNHLEEFHNQSTTYCIRKDTHNNSTDEINKDLDHISDGESDSTYWHIEQSHPHNIQLVSSSTLTRKILEASANCNQSELKGISKLNIVHKDLTSLGVSILGQWCPKLQLFIINESRLNTLKGAFCGCEKSLEYVFVKNNLLNDFKGLESLYNLKVLFLEGNFISHIGPCTNEQNNLEGSRVIISKTSKKNCLSSNPCTSCRSWQGTPRFVKEKNDIVSYDCLTSRHVYSQYTKSLWPKLKRLYLSNNRITRIWELCNLCPNLEVLDLGCNELVTLGGCEGQALIGLKNLQILDVGQNKIKGRSLWKGLNHCPLLVSLVASRNQLTKLPTHFGNVMLREIWLNGNYIKCLACKAWLPNLQRFYLQDNLIDNLESFLCCPSLEVSLFLHLIFLFLITNVHIFFELILKVL